MTTSIATSPFRHSAPHPRISAGARVWAGAAMLLGGFGLVLLSGCFLIGVMVLVDPPSVNAQPGAGPLTSEQYFLLIILYVLAGLCLLGALLLFALGARGLLRVLLEKPEPS